jgi:multidrug efflux pump subunit AcrA (membrane-fusion protein)
MKQFYSWLAPVVAVGLTVGLVARSDAQPGGARAAKPAEARSGTVVLDYCLVSAFDQVQVPAREASVLKAFEANASREGAEVAKGDVLGHLDNDDLVVKLESAKAEYDIAVAQAESDAELQVAIKSKAVAEAELKSAEEANRKAPGTVPGNELRRLKLTVEKVAEEIKLRTVERSNHALTAKGKKAQMNAVKVELERREVTSPLDGVVVERLKHEGEWVQPGETILKIVRLDRLRVEGLVLAQQYSPKDIAGAKVLVSVQTPGGKVETAEGVIEFVNPVVQGSGEYRVWTEIENRKDAGHWVFRPGTVAKMEIVLKSGGAATRPVSTTLRTRDE